MKEEFLKKIFAEHKKVPSLPSSGEICEFASDLLNILFPQSGEMILKDFTSLEENFESLEARLIELLTPLYKNDSKEAENICKKFFGSLPSTYDLIRTDIDAIVAGDPAAKDDFEVVRAYPGFYAIAFFRIAHLLHELEIPLYPRIITEYAHSITGVDIHPGATIGAFFCIDHGTGIVIGETTIIGKNVKIYQGVTLGALSVNKNMASKKRHPTIEDHVVIYAGATILGAETVIGHHSIIGGNVWLTKSVPPHSAVYHKAQVEIHPLKNKENLEI